MFKTIKENIIIICMYLVHNTWYNRLYFFYLIQHIAISIKNSAVFESISLVLVVGETILSLCLLASSNYVWSLWLYLLPLLLADVVFHQILLQVLPFFFSEIAYHIMSLLLSRVFFQCLDLSILVRHIPNTDPNVLLNSPSFIWNLECRWAFRIVDQHPTWSLRFHVH